MSDDRRLAKIRWSCRRGMKELDLMLERFVLQQEAAICAGDWPQLESLLAHEDDQLWDWLQGRAYPEDIHLQALVSAICSGTSSTH